MKIKFTAVLLSIVFIVMTAAACGENNGENSSQQSSVAEQSENSGNPSEDPSGADLSDEEFDDGLPETNFGGRDFTILQRSEYKYEYEPDDTAAEKVNILIAERNRLVEERFGVKIKTINQLGAWGQHENFMTYVRNTVNGGTADYDIISGYAAIMPSLISDGLFINWYELDEYINFEKDWWSQDFISEMSLNNKLYVLSGDISLTFWESMQCVFFNKTLAESYNMNNLYDMVWDGKWTFDAMYQIIKDTYNENSVVEDQIYGYTTALTTQIDVYQDAFNIPVTTKDADGKPYFTINVPKTYDALAKLYDLVVASPYTKVCTEANQMETTVSVFGEGKALFAPLYLGTGAQLQSYNTIYGILPMPKFNEEQAGYYSTCCDFYSVLSIPLTSDGNLDFIGIITEALCVESARSVVPEYYSLVLKERYTNDEDSIKIIDMVREGILCNFGYLYSYTLNWPAHQLNVCINNKNTNFASNWESKEGEFNNNLQEAIAFYFDE